MITRSDQDWTTLNLAALQALQLSARKTLVDIAPTWNGFTTFASMPEALNCALDGRRCELASRGF